MKLMVAFHSFTEAPKTRTMLGDFLTAIDEDMSEHYPDAVRNFGS